MKMLEVNNLNLGIRIKNNYYNALEDISFHIDYGEIVGIAGESGSGKSLTAYSIMGLLPELARIASGEILLEGKNLLQLKESEKCSIRGKELSIIFQEPMTALNPLMTVGKQIEEAYVLHNKCTKAEAYERTLDIMKKTGLSRIEDLYHEYPHRLSGGMKQRIVIAMALINRPKALIADEPTTALDVTIQYQILEMIKELSVELNSSVLLISHDIGVLREICSRIIIMYSGQIVEEGSAKDILSNPLHPYTRGLLDSIPAQNKKGSPLYSIPGSVMPLVRRNYIGCSFASRCPYASQLCIDSAPAIRQQGNRSVRCFKAGGEMINESRTIA